MNRPAILRVAVLSVAAVVVVLNTVSGPSHGTVPRSPARDEEIVAFIRDQVADAGVPGAAVAIVRDGRVSTVAGIGVADSTGRPVTSRTPFVIGSLSKSITATAVMQLVEAGRVRLDAPVRTYLPDFRIADPAASASITVRQLLDHTSGLSTAAGQDPLRGPATDLATNVRRLADVQLLWAPGTRYEYSNANYFVLGRLIEVVSGTSYGSYLERHVFRPLGMADATTDVQEADASGLTRAHRLWFGAPREVAPLVRPDLAPAGFVIASASDVGRFVASQVNGGTLDGSRILSSALVVEMGRGSVDTGAGDGSRYGLGWVDGTVGGIRLVGHAGSTTDMASVAYFSPERRDGIVLLLNGQSTLYELAHKPDLVGLAAFELLQGREPDGTLTALYPAFDALCLAMVGYLAWRLARVVRDARRRELALPRPWGCRGLGIAWTVWLGLVLPVEILVAVPRLLGAPWTTLIRIDVGLVAFLLAFLRLSIGAVYVVAALRESWRWGLPGRTGVVSAAGGE